MRHASLLLAASTLPALACATVHAGELFLLGLVPQSFAIDASDDGRTVVGYDPASYWYWTRETGVVQLIGTTTPPGNGVGGSAALTADGREMMCQSLVGDPQKSEGSVYDIAFTTIETIGSYGSNCDISRSSAWGMSPNGRHVVGLAWEPGCEARAFHYDRQSQVMTNLGTLYFFNPSRANAVSDDGRVIAGWNDDYVGYRQGAVWVRDETTGVYVQTNMVAPPPAGSTVGVKMREAGVVSGDGRFVFGIGRTNWNNGAIWRWSAEEGVVPMAPNPFGSMGYPVAANHDGSKVLCFFGAAGGLGAYLWSAERGYVRVNDLAAEAGVEVPDGWFLDWALGMSEDAMTIVGTAVNPENGVTSPFVLDLRETVPPCTADFNNDGIVDAQDLAALLGQWGAFGGSADLNGDFQIDAQDLTILLGEWANCG